jgi:hypothetical protein
MDIWLEARNIRTEVEAEVEEIHTFRTRGTRSLNVKVIG